MGRRKNNKGSICYRAERPKPWVGQYSISGKRVTESFLSEEEAQAWLDRALGAAEEGIKDEFFIDYLNRWLQLKNPKQLDDKADQIAKEIAELDGIKPVRPSTFELYSGTLRRHILPKIHKDLRMSQIKRNDIKQILGSCIRAGVGKRTQEEVRKVLHLALEDAIKLKIIEKNPADDFHIEYKPKERTPLLPEEADKVILAARGTQLEILIPLAMTTIARQGELLAATWDDIDWDKRILKIRKTVQTVMKNDKNVKEIGDPKTEASIRDIVLGEETVEYFYRQMQLVDLWRQAAGSDWKENNLIFPTYIGTYIDRSNLRRLFYAILASCGLPPTTHFHDLRHTGVTAMSLPEVGASLKTAQKRAGHKSEAMTSYYTHPIEPVERDAAEKLDQFFLPKLEDFDPASLVRRDRRKGKGKGVKHQQKKKID